MGVRWPVWNSLFCSKYMNVACWVRKNTRRVFQLNPLFWEKTLSLSLPRALFLSVLYPSTLTFLRTFPFPPPFLFFLSISFFLLFFCLSPFSYNLTLSAMCTIWTGETAGQFRFLLSLNCFKNGLTRQRDTQYCRTKPTEPRRNTLFRHKDAEIQQKHNTKKAEKEKKLSIRIVRANMFDSKLFWKTK